MNCANPTMRRGRPRGLSIVEMLVGISIGLFVLAGATLVTSSQLSDNRMLLLEAQMQQDLRATADLIAREVRRSGYWGRAYTTTWGATAATNMYQSFKGADDADERPEVKFSYSSALSAATEDGVSGVNEKFGFAWNKTNGTIDALMGGAGWQALTDPSVMRVVEPTVIKVEADPKLMLKVPCASECPGGGTDCWPTQKLRYVTFIITGQAVHDSSIKRSIKGNVRLRNDEVTGTCPA